MGNLEIRRNLEQIAKKIIDHKVDTYFLSHTVEHRDASGLLANKSSMNNNHNSQDRMTLSSYSFIEKKENNQFEFEQDPSFVYFKEPSVAHGDNPSFDYVPDLQIFKNMETDRKFLAYHSK